MTGPARRWDSSPVLLAGHPDGGAAITVARVAENVVGLVSVAARLGEAVGDDVDAEFLCEAKRPITTARVSVLRLDCCSSDPPT